jgi:hypothetical protein
MLYVLYKVKANRDGVQKIVDFKKLLFASEKLRISSNWDVWETKKFIGIVSKQQKFLESIWQIKTFFERKI